MTTLAVLGVGKIGGEVAFLSSIQGLADELVIYDAATEFLRAQVLDLKHTGIDIGISTNPRLVKDADICVFSAGLPRNQNIKSRTDLLNANLPVATECSNALRGFGGVLITVTNPMDENNYYLCKKIGLLPRQCIGFGGQLDSARFGLAMKNYGLSGEPWVIGEHGEHQVPLISRLQGMVSNQNREEILAYLQGASMEIIRGKGGTVFGPAHHITSLIRDVVNDARGTISCSCVLDGEYGFSNCSLGVPARVGREGILAIEDWKLDEWEREHLDRAGNYVTSLCKTLHV
ncbi:MAG TPA: lactate dehydrogenase [Methanoregulaceae archaeon]|nr:lactate dehydrogenase [Methanoregulaceae archaeon]